MSKDHNASLPILESVETLNRYGLEIVSGIILGLDTDRPDSGEQILDFMAQSKIPMRTVNLRQALPMTPLGTRVEAAGRIDDDETRESNVVFRLPYDDVVAMWRHCMGEAYTPERVYRRFLWNVEHTYPNRIKPISRTQATWASVTRGLGILGRILLHVGVLAPYRRDFWRHVGPLLKAGKIEEAIHLGVVAHHLITFARSAASGRQNASFYSERVRDELEAA
jgi:hypothetical protein